MSLISQDYINKCHHTAQELQQNTSYYVFRYSNINMKKSLRNIILNINLLLIIFLRKKGLKN